MPPTSTLLAAPFRQFFLGRLVSLLGSSMTPVALALAVLDASGRPADLGVVLAAQLVPNLALLLVGGAVADRFPRRTVLIIANLGAGLTQGAVAAVLLTGHYSLPLIGCLEFGNGALAAFTSSALRGIVAELVTTENLQRANSLLASVRNATRILGPTAAGLLVVAAGGGWAIAADALGFVVAAGFFARLRAGPAVRPWRGRLRTDIREGWRTFRSTPWVWPVSLSFCVVNLVNTGAWQVLGPTLTTQRSGETTWGAVLSVRAAGLLLMSVLMYRLLLRRPLRSGQPAAALGALGLFALGIDVGVPCLMACVFVAGMGFTLAGISWETALQQHIPRDALSRVSSIDDLLSFAAIPVGQLLVGPVAALFGAANLALCCGIAFAVAAIAPLAAPAVRGLASR